MSGYDITVSFNAGKRVDEWAVAAKMLVDGKVGFRFQDYMDCFGEEAAESLEDLLEKYRPHSFIAYASNIEADCVSLEFEWPFMDAEAMVDHFEVFLTLCGATDISISGRSNQGD